MKKVAWFSAALFVAACGSDNGGGTEPDGGGDVDAEAEADAEVDDRDISGPTTAFEENENGGRDEVGLANWGCLGDPDDAEETQNEIVVTGRITEFLGNALEDVEVAVFDSNDFYADPYAGPVAAVDPDDGEDGLLYEDLAIPAGVTRVAFRITTSDTLITFSLGHTFEPEAETDERDVGAVGDTTAGILAGAALQGPRTQGLGIVAGDVVDCDGNTVRNAIGAMSTTSGTLTPYDNNERTFYFGGQLPVRANTETQADGRFLIPEIEPTEDPVYVQVWGYQDQDAYDNDELTLLSELETTIIADGLITSGFPPLTAAE
jgi:hypothetical protein